MRKECPMRKIVLSMKLMATLVALLALPLSALAESITYTVNYDYNNVTIGTASLGEANYTTVHYSGLFNESEPGLPSLPIDIIQFSVPYNASNFTISSFVPNYNQQDIDYPIYPCQLPKTLSDTIERITPPDSVIYSMSIYPSSAGFAWVIDDGFIAGENHIVSVAIMPIRLRHNNSAYQLQFAKTVNLSLNFIISETTSNHPLICSDVSKRIEGHKITETLVVNPNDVITNAPSQSLNGQFLAGNNRIPTLPAYFVDSLDKSTIDYREFDYLIITTDSLRPSLKRLSALKGQKGYRVGTVNVDEIVDNPLIDINRLVSDELIDDAYDYPTIIRLFLTYAYVYGKAKYILLAGRDVPFLDDDYHQATDQYYCDLSSNWYGFSAFKGPELYPGRIIARSKDQIINYTDKLFRYELNPGNGDYSYLKRALYTNGYDQYVDSLSYVEMIKYFADSIFVESTLMFENRQTGFPSGKDVIDEINRAQYGFISFNNHGIPTGIVMYGKGGTGHHSYKWLWAVDSVHGPASATYHVNDDSLSGNALNNMVNKYYPNICYSTCCSVMPFGVKDGYDPSWMNFGESFTTGKDYGGPAFMGNTAENGFEMANLGGSFAKKLSDGHHHIGVAYALAKVKNVSPSIGMIHNLLGDPEFEVWTDFPQIYSNISITRTNNSVSISGIDSDSTIVAYYANDGQVGTDTVSTSNVTLNGISPNSTIMLYKHNQIPYIAPMVLQNTTLSNSQYVIASDVTAGNYVDNNRTSGNVTVTDGIEYEIEASGKVTLEDGFIVEKGATFSIYTSCLNQ